jgi:hypothetical protein
MDSFIANSAATTGSLIHRIEKDKEAVGRPWKQKGVWLALEPRALCPRTLYLLPLYVEYTRWNLEVCELTRLELRPYQ